MKRGGLVRRRFLRRRSARGERFDREYRTRRRIVVAMSNGLCQARLDGCTQLGEHVHHRAGRDVKDANAIRNLIHVCGSCHDYIHAHPAQSYANGLLIHSWEAQ